MGLLSAVVRKAVEGMKRRCKLIEEAKGGFCDE